MNHTEQSHQALEQIYQDFNIQSDSVVLVHEYDLMPPLAVKNLYDQLNHKLTKGTLGVFGNETLNEHVALHETLKTLTTQERMVLGSGPLLQLLTLDTDCRFASHPTHLIGFKGKYAPYLSRKFDYDFPYGPISIYNDLYGMDATVIHLGKKSHAPELKHVYSKRQDAVIQKNTLLQRGETVGYLDYDADMDALCHSLSLLDIVKVYEWHHLKVYVYSYQAVIDSLRLQSI